MGNKIYHILLKGECPLWEGTMRRVLACHSCCVLTRDGGDFVSHIFCDLDALPLDVLRAYKNKNFTRLCGFYSKNMSAQKKACCDAVFKKNMPIHRVLSFLGSSQENKNAYALNDVMLINALYNGLSDKQISFDLQLPVSTVKYHLRRLYKKLRG